MPENNWAEDSTETKVYKSSNLYEVIAFEAKDYIEQLYQTDFKYPLEDEYRWGNREPNIDSEQITGVEVTFNGLVQITIEGAPNTLYEIKYQNGDKYQYIINNTKCI